MRPAAGVLLAVSIAALVACRHAPPEVVESVVVKKPLAGKSVPAKPVAAAAAGGTKYTVQKGDTLYSIAFRYGLDFRTLAALNGVREPYTIFPGQVLVIKSRGAPAPVRADRVAVAPRVPEPPASSGAAVHPPKSSPGSTAPSAPASAPTVATPPASAIRAVPAAPAAQAASAAGPASPAAERQAPVVAKPTVPAQTRLVGGGHWQWPAPGRLLSRFNARSVGPKGISIAGETGDAVRVARDGRVVYTGSSLVGYGQLVIVKHDDVYLSAYAHNSRLMVKEGDAVRAGQQIAEMGSTGTDRAKLHFEVRRNGDPVDPLSVLPLL
jgi:lipoprotein NlpD